MNCFTCERKNYAHDSSNQTFKYTDSNIEKKIEKPKITFELFSNQGNNGEHCIKDSLTIRDNVHTFKRKICYWGDGDSSIYSEHQTTLSHKYLNSGIKIIQLVCDTFMPVSKQIVIKCRKPDTLDFSIHPLNRPNISGDTLRFDNDLKLFFSAVDESSKWLIDGKSYNYDAEITFKKPHRTVEVTFLAGNGYGCICDSTLRLTFVKKK